MNGMGTLDAGRESVPIPAGAPMHPQNSFTICMQTRQPFPVLTSRAVGALRKWVCTGTRRAFSPPSRVRISPLRDSPPQPTQRGVIRALFFSVRFASWGRRLNLFSSSLQLGGDAARDRAYRDPSVSPGRVGLHVQQHEAFDVREVVKV